MAKEQGPFYTHPDTGIRYPYGDLFGYPDSLIRGRTEAAYAYGVNLVAGNPSVVLDYGSGRGHGLLTIQEALHPTRIVSLDKHFPYLEAQRAVLTNGKINPFEFVHSQGSPLPFEDGSVDAIFFMHVIEHVEDPKGLLVDMLRILPPGGELVVATPSRKNLVGNNPEDEHVFTESELETLLSESGFDVSMFHVVPNEKAWKVHTRKRRLARRLPITGRLRNRVPIKVWDSLVLRLGISRQPLDGADFECSDEHPQTAIDILALAIKPDASVAQISIQ